ncbi:MAG: hypothetical protein U0031_00630 [Thermomicrobiales bacterium]
MHVSATEPHPAEIAEALLHTAREVLRVCAARRDERVLILNDEATAPEITAAFRAALDGTDAAILTMAPRQPAFADLPPHALDAVLAADLVLDLTTVPWLYSDSWTHFTRQCGSRGTRLALIWGMPGSMRTLAACPPSPRLTAQARRVLAAMNRARAMRIRSGHGTDFTVALGDPETYRRGFIGEPPATPGSIGAPLCASVTAPFVPWTARGTLAFVGAGRFQGPQNLPLRTRDPVRISVAEGRVTAIAGENAAAVTLADWFAQAVTDDVYRIMDCNIGCDPRAELDWADNSVVHSFSGGVMIGIASPYEYRPEGSHRPGFHLDLMFPGTDVDLDGEPFIRSGTFVSWDEPYRGDD